MVLFVNEILETALFVRAVGAVVSMVAGDRSDIDQCYA